MERDIARPGPRSLTPAMRRGAGRLLAIAFFGVVAYFAIRYARNVDWAEVWRTMLDTPRGVLLAALALTALSHAVYSNFDQIGRRYTGHRLPRLRVWQVNFVSYAFNLNLGSIVGSVGFRYRLYTRLGLDAATITRVTTLSILTNWLGYVLLAGLLFTTMSLPLPEHWKIGGEGLRWLGVILLAVGIAYLLAAFFAKKRSIVVRGHEIILPPARMALVQVVVSVANWMIMGAIIWTLLQGKAAYAVVLSVLLVAAIAGAVTHVPAGIGVLEAIFLALLTPAVPEGALLAALLTYRGIYFLLPLVLAALFLAMIEMRGGRARHAARSGAP